MKSASRLAGEAATDALYWRRFYSLYASSGKDDDLFSDRMWALIECWREGRKVPPDDLDREYRRLDVADQEPRVEDRPEYWERLEEVRNSKRPRHSEADVRKALGLPPAPEGK